jgi:hypothetical protein
MSGEALSTMKKIIASSLDSNPRLHLGLAFGSLIIIRKLSLEARLRSVCLSGQERSRRGWGGGDGGAEIG